MKMRVRCVEAGLLECWSCQDRQRNATPFPCSITYIENKITELSDHEIKLYIIDYAKGHANCKNNEFEDCIGYLKEATKRRIPNIDKYLALL